MDYNACLKKPDDLPVPIINPMATPAARMAPLDRRDVARLSFVFLLLDTFCRRRVSILPSVNIIQFDMEDHRHYQS